MRLSSILTVSFFIFSLLIMSIVVSNIVVKAENNAYTGYGYNNGYKVLDRVLNGDIEWIDPQENTISLNEHFVRDNFIIEASDFYNSDNDNTVLITVYDTRYGMNDNGIVSNMIARANDSWNVTDKTNTYYMNILIKDLKMVKGNISANEGLNVIVDERVKIQTRFVGQPAPKLSILPKGRDIGNNRTVIDRIYNQGSEISINFSIKNEGKATLRNMHLIVNRDKDNSKNLPFLFSDEKVDRELPDLIANDTNIINIRFRAPNVNKNTIFNISGTVVGKDSFGRQFNVTDHTFITVRYFYDKLISVQKFLPEKIYMGDYVDVAVYVQNNGFSNISNMSLEEQIPDGFAKLNNFNYNFSFGLIPFERKLFLYKLRPIKPGIYNFPAESSIVTWDSGLEFNNKSNVVIVNGPYVELKKYGSVEGDNIRINILARNSGDMTAIVRLRDLIPLDGAVTKSLVLRPNSVASFSYTINMANINITNGKAVFPRASGIVLDQYLFTNERYAQQVFSNDLVLVFGNNSVSI